MGIVACDTSQKGCGTTFIKQLFETQRCKILYLFFHNLMQDLYGSTFLFTSTTVGLNIKPIVGSVNSISITRSLIYMPMLIGDQLRMLIFSLKSK